MVLRAGLPATDVHRPLRRPVWSCARAVARVMVDGSLSTGACLVRSAMTLAACVLVWRVAASGAGPIPSCVCCSLARVAAGPGDGLRREVRSGLEGRDEGFIGHAGRDRSW